jgi:hypothetical protein
VPGSASLILCIVLTTNRTIVAQKTGIVDTAVFEDD